MSPLPIYIITIARARDRLDAILASTENLGLDLRPIDGVDGKNLPEDQWAYLDRRGFYLENGRTPLPGEYGCYASHIIALERFLAEGSDFALIVEDDVIFTQNTSGDLQKILSVAPKDSLIKLTCHRRSGFHKRNTFENGVTFGRYFFGPQGSSAAYIISRKAAQKFLRTSIMMRVPFDRAIENGWDNGINVLNTPDDILGFGDRGTLIATLTDYRATKFGPIKRVPKYIKAAYDNVARLIYAIV